MGKSERFKCKQCGKFLSDVWAHINGENEVSDVRGKCTTHGEVQVTDWDYEDFFPCPTVAQTATEGK